MSRHVECSCNAIGVHATSVCGGIFESFPPGREFQGSYARRAKNSLDIEGRAIAVAHVKWIRFGPTLARTSSIINFT